MIEETASICPVCYKTIPALRIERGDKIYLQKECREHGRFEALIWEDASSWYDWKTHGVDSVPSMFDKKSLGDCPHDCGLCENHQQKACCVLIEITQNCDQNCRYCFASAHSNNGRTAEPTLSEIRRIYLSLLERSSERPFNIQLSGGEPTLREDLPDIIRMGKELGFPYIQLNTNGRRLASDPAYAGMLLSAGLSSVFLQFDGTNDRIYDAIRGKPLFSVKEKAIQNCTDAGLGVVLVVTVVPGVNDENLGEILKYAIRKMPYVRGIHFQPVSYFGRFPGQPGDADRITIPTMIKKLVDQSEDRLAPSQFIPLQTGHAVCSFHGNFVVMEDGSMTSISVDPKKAGCSCGERSIEKARDYIARKWTYEDRKMTGTAAPEIGGEPDPSTDNLEPADYREPADSSYDFSSWDLFLERIHSRGFSITAMAFQDAWNLDLERLKKCRVQVAVKDGGLIPFCAYNILHRQDQENEVKSK